MTFWVAAWLRAFAITLAIELVIAGALLARSEPRLGRRLAGIALCNLATHPLVWFAFPGLTLAYPLRVASSELFAVGVETAGYATLWPHPRRMAAWRRGALVSLVANTASFATGLLLRAVGLGG